MLKINALTNYVDTSVHLFQYIIWTNNCWKRTLRERRIKKDYNKRNFGLSRKRVPQVDPLSRKTQIFRYILFKIHA